jgi:hypothetical protein
MRPVKVSMLDTNSRMRLLARASRFTTMTRLPVRRGGPFFGGSPTSKIELATSEGLNRRRLGNREGSVGQVD